MKVIIVLFICLLFVTLEGCSGSENAFDGRDTDYQTQLDGEMHVSAVNLRIKKIYPWLNLMQGRAKKTFNITGDITILPSSNYDMNSIKLKLIKIYQKGVFIYMINPTIRQIFTNEDDQSHNIIFSTIKGVEIIPFYKMDNVITIELIFNDGGESLSYIIPQVKVEKYF